MHIHPFSHEICNVIFRWTYKFSSSQEKILSKTTTFTKSVFTFLYSLREFLVPNFLYANQEDEGMLVTDKKDSLFSFNSQENTSILIHKLSIIKI